MSQPARRMNSAVPATLFLIASGGLHVLLLLGLTRSASGAENAWDEREPARFVGNTFEIETVDAPPQAAGSPAPPEAAGSPAPDAPSAPSPEAPSAVEPEPPSPPASPPVAAAPAVPSPPIAPVETSEPPPVQREPVLPPTVPAPPSAHASHPQTGSGATAPAPPGSAAAATAPSGAAPAYGQDALPASSASFAKAFTRAVPRIASADKVWHGLALGSAGSAVFSIEVDAQGKVVGQGTVLDKPVPAAHLARIIGRTVLLLRNQTFAHAAEGEAPVSQRFELSAEIRQVAALDDTFAEPEDLRQIGRLVEPTLVRPGKANFTYNSGRQVELTVRLLNP